MESQRPPVWPLIDLLSDLDLVNEATGTVTCVGQLRDSSRCDLFLDDDDVASAWLSIKHIAEDGEASGLTLRQIAAKLSCSFHKKEPWHLNGVRDAWMDIIEMKTIHKSMDNTLPASENDPFTKIRRPVARTAALPLRRSSTPPPTVSDPERQTYRMSEHDSEAKSEPQDTDTAATTILSRDASEEQDALNSEKNPRKDSAQPVSLSKQAAAAARNPLHHIAASRAPAFSETSHQQSYSWASSYGQRDPAAQYTPAHIVRPPRIPGGFESGMSFSERFAAFDLGGDGDIVRPRIVHPMSRPRPDDPRTNADRFRRERTEATRKEEEKKRRVFQAEIDRLDALYQRLKRERAADGRAEEEEEGWQSYEHLQPEPEPDGQAASWETSWQAYEQAWKRVEQLSRDCSGEDLLAAIPLPMADTKRANRQPGDEYFEKDVREFFKKLPGGAATLRKKLKSEASRWHEDKVRSRFPAAFGEGAVRELSTRVMQIVSDLLNQM